MRKLDSLSKLRDRMGSNIHEPRPAEETAENRMSDATDNEGSPLVGALDARAEDAERLKGGSRKVAGATASVIRDASSKVADVTPETGDRVMNRSRKAAASVGRKASSRAAGVTAATSQRVRAGSRSALDATASVASQLMTATQYLLASNLSQDLNNLLNGLVKGSATIYDNSCGERCGKGCLAPRLLCYPLKNSGAGAPPVILIVQLRSLNRPNADAIPAR